MITHEEIQELGWLYDDDYNTSLRYTFSDWSVRVRDNEFEFYGPDSHYSNLKIYSKEQLEAFMKMAGIVVKIPSYLIEAFNAGINVGIHTADKPLSEEMVQYRGRRLEEDLREISFRYKLY